jgi:hypothetical protein
MPSLKMEVNYIWTVGEIMSCNLLACDLKDSMHLSTLEETYTTKPLRKLFDGIFAWVPEVLHQHPLQELHDYLACWIHTAKLEHLQ